MILAYSVFNAVGTSPVFGGMGKRARRTVASRDALFRMVDGKFPIVKYIGQAFLSPEKLVRYVSSDARIIGMMVERGGNFSYYGSVKKSTSYKRIVKMTCVSHHQSPVCISVKMRSPAVLYSLIGA